MFYSFYIIINWIYESHFLAHLEPKRNKNQMKFCFNIWGLSLWSKK